MRSLYELTGDECCDALGIERATFGPSLRHTHDMALFDEALRRDYGENLKAHIMAHNSLLRQLYPNGIPKPSRWRKVKRLLRQRPHLSWY